MRYLLMIVLLFSFNQVRAVDSGFYNSSELLELFEAYLKEGTIENVTNGNVCFGYVLGMSDMHDAFVKWGDMKPSWCTPEKITGKQLILVVTKHLQEHSERSHFAASTEAGNALIKAFPCE